MSTSNEIYVELRKRLEERQYIPGSRFPSEITLAGEFGVCKVTINKIVSKLVEQGYIMRGIRGAGTRVSESWHYGRGEIAFISKLSSYSVEVLRGLQQECLHSGYAPVVFSPNSEELPQCLRTLQRKEVVGLVSIGYGPIKLNKDVPCVCVDYTLAGTEDSAGVEIIGSDDFGGGRKMMEEIIRRGHRNIALFSSERFVFCSTAPVSQRICGFHSALAANGLANIIARTFYAMPNSLGDAEQCVKTILKKYPETTIVCTDSDPSAELFSYAAAQLGVDCPGKIALTGFGHVTHMKIATVNQHPERQGRLAALYIRSCLEKDMTPLDAERFVETSLDGIEYIPICGNS